MLIPSKRDQVGRQTPDGRCTLAWFSKGDWVHPVETTKQLAYVERRGALTVFELASGALVKELRRTHVIVSHVDEQLWLQTSRGYERIEPGSLEAVEGVTLPAARWEGKTLLWGVHDAFRSGFVYRSAEDRKFRFSNAHPDYLAAVEFDSGDTKYLLELPAAGNVEDLWTNDRLLLCSVRREDERVLMVFSRRKGETLQVAKPARGRVRVVVWGKHTLAELGERWHRWDDAQRRLRPAVGIAKGASLQVLGRELLAHHPRGLQRLEFDGTRFVPRARQARLKNSCAAFRVGRSLGCFVSTAGTYGPYSLAWLDPGDLRELGRSELEVSGELRVTVAGRHVLLETDDGLAALRIGGARGA